MSKKKCPEFENHERWLISFADMLTLLFATFVVLYSLNLSSEKSESKAAGSMQESFNTPLEDIPLDRAIGSLEQGFGVFEYQRGSQIEAPLSKKFPSEKDYSAIINQDMEMVQKRIEERLYGQNKFREKKADGAERIVSVERTEKGFKLKLLARHFYENGSYILKRDSKIQLDKIISSLKDLEREIMIEGHTDSSQQSGEYSYWDISALRATHIAKYMVRKHNFLGASLGASGYGDYRPIAHNGTESGRTLNRRVEFHVHYPY